MSAQAPEKTESTPAAGSERARPRPAYRPAVDLIETAEAVLLFADMPGVSDKDVEIGLEKNVLTIQGRVEPPALEGCEPLLAEYNVGDWERSFTLSNEIDRDRIEAVVKDGVLQVRLPKSRESASRKIRVTAG